MAIGSEGEIGTNFTTWGKMSQEDKEAWFAYMNAEWNPLMKGYAILIHDKTNNPYYSPKD